MEQLSKDAIIQIALTLEMEHLLNYCLTSKRFNRLICDNDEYWLLRLAQDHPNASNFYIYNTPYKQLYLSFIDNLDYQYVFNIGINYDPDPGNQIAHQFGQSAISVDLSKYIPIADVKSILFETSNRFIRQLKENITWYMITLDSEDIWSKEVLSPESFDITVTGYELVVDAYVRTLPNMNIFNSIELDTIYEEVLTEYIESISQTDKAHLVPLVLLELRL